MCTGKIKNVHETVSLDTIMPVLVIKKQNTQMLSRYAGCKPDERLVKNNCVRYYK